MSLGEQDRWHIRDAVLRCDQEKLNQCAMAFGLLGESAEAEAVMRAELAAAPHDVQVWWSGECNCDGHLN